MGRVRPWGKATAAEYHGLGLRAQELLAEVPLHDVWRVSLPGENRTCTMLEVRSVAQALAEARSFGLAVSALFSIRRRLGGLFGWDRAEPQVGAPTLLERLGANDRDASLIEPGVRDGPFSVVYVHPHEAVSEIRNATAQAYLVWSIKQVPGGHELLWAIHVLPVSAWTAPYMAMISPFRRFVVYPTLLRRFHEEWRRGPQPAA